jgi:hypothetical protein
VSADNGIRKGEGINAEGTEADSEEALGLGGVDCGGRAAADDCF